MVNARSGGGGRVIPCQSQTGLISDCSYQLNGLYYHQRQARDGERQCHYVIGPLNSWGWGCWMGVGFQFPSVSCVFHGFSTDFAMN